VISDRVPTRQCHDARRDIAVRSVCATHVGLEFCGGRGGGEKRAVSADYGSDANIIDLVRCVYQCNHIYFLLLFGFGFDFHLAPLRAINYLTS
jgi:hypothetical protein